MGKPTGFIEFTRELPGKRSTKERVNDYREFVEKFPEEKLNQQAKTLKDDNEKLLKANNVWYLKYQDLLDRQENNLPLMLATPMKRKP